MATTTIKIKMKMKSCESDFVLLTEIEICIVRDKMDGVRRKTRCFGLILNPFQLFRVKLQKYVKLEPEWETTIPRIA